jgi:prevent-host-death family protein
MSEVLVGVRELKAHLSDYMRRVKHGDTVVITDRGKRVARLTPLESALTSREKVQLLARAGLLEWNGEDIPDEPPPAKARKGTSVSDIVIDSGVNVYLTRVRW